MGILADLYNKKINDAEKFGYVRSLLEGETANIKDTKVLEYLSGKLEEYFQKTGERATRLFIPSLDYSYLLTVFGLTNFKRCLKTSQIRCGYMGKLFGDIRVFQVPTRLMKEMEINPSDERMKQLGFGCFIDNDDPSDEVAEQCDNEFSQRMKGVRLDEDKKLLTPMKDIHEQYERVKVSKEDVDKYISKYSLTKEQEDKIRNTRVREYICEKVTKVIDKNISPNNFVVNDSDRIVFDNWDEGDFGRNEEKYYNQGFLGELWGMKVYSNDAVTEPEINVSDERLQQLGIK
jgi:hypothetical protein